MQVTRQAAWELLTAHTKSESLLKHALAVEAAMRAYARRFGEDEEVWAALGLVHDHDYEENPTAEQHPFVGAKNLQALGWPADIIEAVLAHGTYTGTPRSTKMATTLFAVDELTGLVQAVALVRPSKNIADVNVKSVKNKWKDKAFAAGVNRADIELGAQELGVDIWEHVGVVLEALQGIAPILGLDGRLAQAAAPGALSLSMHAARRQVLTPLLSLSLLFLLTLFVLAPLTRPGFPQTAAGFQPVWELNLLAQGGGWSALTGEADLARGDGLLPRYVALVLRSSGVDGRDALKATLALAYLLGGIGVYGWLRRRWGEPAALLAGVVYTFLPYRLAVTYVAGGLGDAWAMALLPWAGWALDALAGEMAGKKPALRPEGTPAKKPILRRVGFGVLSLAVWVALAACNVGLAVWFALIAGAALLAAGRKPISLLPLLLAVPALIVGILRGGAGDFHSHYPYLFQLFSASWNAAPSGAGWINEMPFQLGLVPLGLAGLALAVSGQRSAGSPAKVGQSPTLPAPLSQNWERGQGVRARPLFILASGIALAVLLSLQISAPFWRITRLDHILTHPWQMLGFAGLGLALLAGSAARQARPLAQLPLLAGLIALAVLSVYPYLSPAWTELTPRAQPAGVFGDGQVALADYRLIGKLYPGAQVQLDLTWQALRRLDGDYTVFVQALDATQKVRGQFDGQPRGGSSPTSQWVPGQIITDTVVLRIDPTGPAQGYQLIIGFYDWRTGRRLPAGADDKVILSEATP